MSDLKTNIEQHLQRFQTLELRPAALALLDSLGYASDKTMKLDGSPAAFLEQFNRKPEATRFNEEKALSNDWKEIQLLFQLTDQELASQVDLFEDNAVKQSLMTSYLFFAVKLSGEGYARGKLAQIARQINRLFPMPVMVLFEYGGKLSIAVINRRRNKRDTDKDVLGKVTLIQDICLETPHRGHLDILESFAVSELRKKHTVSSFDTLHAAWEEVFNVELLNKKFYRELSNWYFWAMQQVHFPYDQLEYSREQLDKGDLFKDKAALRAHDAKNLIRLLTRLLFVWFIKEKGLVPNALFEKEALENELLKTFDAESKETHYYKAILQNLFFATLNQTQGKRQFRTDKQHRNTTTLMRYQSSFQCSEKFIQTLEEVVPFMNGGLFECLDKPHPTLKGRQGGDVILYEDGFSDRKDNALNVPDCLFFGEEQTIDLSDIYGDKKRKKETVRGIIPILNSYKFTIVENTPIEQEIALDPELLGKVFENLLASYNPETKTTARKQTGSFYTPRTIVDYMVDESLKAYLQKALTTGVQRKGAESAEARKNPNISSAKLCESLSPSRLCVEDVPLMTEEDAKEGLEILFSYTEKEHVFNDVEKHALITAIDSCKILDPACGSGAFPMGILHKLVFILSKLDPGNDLWKQRQLDKLDSAAMREDLETIFENNDDDYGRKLYLIENCIYGVDIQSVATQVSKLRFFISLIVDQKVSRPVPQASRLPDAGKSRRDACGTPANFGIRPLPNLEIKFATANTLIQIEKPKDQGELFDSAKVQTLEKELKKVRHNLFNAKTPSTKRKHRERDKELREEIAGELEANGWSNTSARQLAGWDPYDQNASSPFFDPEWMFDLPGFDIVIGNPPYVVLNKKSFSERYRKLLFKLYEVAEYKADLYALFLEQGCKLLKKNGVLTYIVPNPWLSQKYFSRLRKFLLQGNTIEEVVTIEPSVFSTAIVDNAIVRVRATHANERTVVKVKKLIDLELVESLEFEEVFQLEWVEPPQFIFQTRLTGVIGEIAKTIIKKHPRLETWADCAIGCQAYNSLKHSRAEIDGRVFHSDSKQSGEYIPEVGGRQVSRYSLEIDSKKWIKHGEWLHDCRPKKWLNAPRVVVREVTAPAPHRLHAAYAEDEFAFYKTVLGAIPHERNRGTACYLCACLNSTVVSFVYPITSNKIVTKTFPRISVADLKALPVPLPESSTVYLFEQLVMMVQMAKREGLDIEAVFLEELIDACVLELYFPEEAAAKDLQFMDQVSVLLNVPQASRLPAPAPSAHRSSATKLEASSTKTKTFVATANDIEHTIRNQLLRLTADSPDLFAVIKQEGRV